MEAKQSADRSFNFVRADTPPEVIKMMFQPETGDEINFFEDKTRLEDLIFAAGIFSSKGEAKRNGFSGELKTGLNSVFFKKRGLTIWYYVPTEHALTYKGGDCPCCND